MVLFQRRASISQEPLPAPLLALVKLVSKYMKRRWRKLEAGLSFGLETSLTEEEKLEARIWLSGYLERSKSRGLLYLVFVKGCGSKKYLKWVKAPIRKIFSRVS